jgi:DNA-binding MarR family transcriptional regulator
MATRTTSENAVEKLTNSILTASRVLVAVAARSLAEHESEVSLAQYRALVVLGSRGSQRPVDLAEALDIEPSTATRLCDRLAAKRLITRRRLSSDRREVTLDLSSRGRALLDAVTERRRKEIREIISAMPSEARADLARAFEAFADAAGEIPEDEWPRSWDL